VPEYVGDVEIEDALASAASDGEVAEEEDDNSDDTETGEDDSESSPESSTQTPAEPNRESIPSVTDTISTVIILFVDGIKASPSWTWARLVALWSSLTSAGSWLKNAFLWGTMGYGEKPQRVIYSSILLVVGFTVVFSWVDGFDGTKDITYNWGCGDPVTNGVFEFGCNTVSTLGLGSWMDYLLVSFQSFITFVLASVTGVSPTIRLVAQLEGFVGAFMVALLVFALTRSVHR
jgi:fumarate reductase subunit D